MNPTIHALLVVVMALMAAYSSPSIATDLPISAVPSDLNPPEVPPAAPGVFSAQKRSADRIHLVVTGHVFTSREAIEKYLAYRAAQLTKEQHADWFSFVEQRNKGDTVAVPKADPTGPRFSFRMEYWRPVWRYKTEGATAWKSWSPFSGNPDFASDPKGIIGYEASADIVLHKGMVAATNPLAFDADALSDFLVNQASPPR